MDQRLTDAPYVLLHEDPFILEKVDQVPFIDTPLHIAASVGKNIFAMEIANPKPSFAKKLNHDGLSPIHLTSTMVDSGMVKEFLIIGRELCLLKGREKRTPLHVAVIFGRIDVINQLINEFLKSLEELTVYKETDDEGNTVLHYATSRALPQLSDVHSIAPGACTYPRSPALVLGLIASATLMVAQLVVSFAAGCICCKRNPHPSKSKWTLALICFVVSWFTVVIGFLVLLSGVVLKDQHGDETMYFGNNCCVKVRGIRNRFRLVTSNRYPWNPLLCHLVIGQEQGGSVGRFYASTQSRRHCNGTTSVPPTTTDQSTTTFCARRNI
ncbi:hypothetical protein HHK36_000838 [Tetracentron sinense]|uniref:PGG domain-containing protein n=1 Tax=Tetracentron sinense TaxID=13715 RepID=A0A835A1Q3_TETSI|nr:hypothetical protein HHK36_000838 [Tetracentron sinense]